MSIPSLPVYHKWCGKIGLYATHRLTAGEVIRARDFATVDGRQPTPGELIRCGACESVMTMNPYSEYGVSFEALEPTGRI